MTLWGLGFLVPLPARCLDVLPERRGCGRRIRLAPAHVAQIAACSLGEEAPGAGLGPDLGLGRSRSGERSTARPAVRSPIVFTCNAVRTHHSRAIGGLRQLLKDRCWTGRLSALRGTRVPTEIESLPRVEKCAPA